MSWFLQNAQIQHLAYSEFSEDVPPTIIAISIFFIKDKKPYRSEC
jgi:hypothetical protein